MNGNGKNVFEEEAFKFVVDIQTNVSSYFKIDNVFPVLKLNSN